MNADDSARLRLAYQAYHNVQPSDFEVSTSAHRIAARMRSQPVRRGRRVQPLVAFGVLLACAIAYAASELARFDEPAGEAPRLEQGTARTPVRVRQPSSPSTRAVPTEMPVQRASQRTNAEREPTTTTQGHERPNTSRTPGSTTTAPRGAKPAGDEATWSEVATALDAGDEERAERALRGMLGHAALGDRAKAQMGLSQLAFGRDDCPAAVRHARAVLADPRAAHLRERARGIVLECNRRSDRLPRLKD